MLCKLLKYDFKSMLRTFVPLWVIVLIFSLSNYALSADPFSAVGPTAILTTSTTSTSILSLVVTVAVIAVVGFVLWKKFGHK